jgi:hypothetical protein
MKKQAVAFVAFALIALSVTPARAVEKRFSTNCSTNQLAQLDPIVSPGPTGTLSSHLHAFFGNNSTKSSSTYESMIAASTSCELSADTAGYWIPPLIDRDRHIVKPSSTNAYYRSVGALRDDDIKPFPKDLRVLSSKYHFHCGEDTHSSAKPVDCRDMRMPHKYVHLTIIFPACWNGMSIDSPDHMSHMAFPTGKGCPESHPVPMPRLVVIARFPIKNARGYTLSSGEPSTAHGDFWNTWQQGALKDLVDRCLGAGVKRTCGHLRG